MRCIIGAITILFLIARFSFAQELEISSPSLRDGETDSNHSLTIFSLLLPQGIRVGSEIREIVRSSAFEGFDSAVSPAESFDEIYYTAVALAHGNLDDAFLGAAYGCLEHEYLPIDLFGHEFPVSITSETHAAFQQRVAHLPTHLYHTPEDDRDKLQHFFASAWLKSWLGMDWLVNLAGEFVEGWESVFLMGESRDPRDIHANHDGSHFATKAEANALLRPSNALTPNP